MEKAKKNNLKYLRRENKLFVSVLKSTKQKRLLCAKLQFPFEVQPKQGKNCRLLIIITIKKKLENFS